MNFDTVLPDGQAANKALDKLVSEPASIGGLNGSTGLLAGEAERLKELSAVVRPVIAAIAASPFMFDVLPWSVAMPSVV